jgi:Flp pilus assembly pilin Flp
MRLISRFVTEDHGAETVEYALILGLVGLTVIAGVSSAGSTIASWWNSMGSLLMNETATMP